MVWLLKLYKAEMHGQYWSRQEITGLNYSLHSLVLFFLFLFKFWLPFEMDLISMENIKALTSVFNVPFKGKPG